MTPFTVITHRSDDYPVLLKMMRAPLAFLICIILGYTVASAHQDDAGDIHPSVLMEDGRFAVYFRNTTDNQTYKTVVAADGTFVSRRQKSQSPPEITPPVPLAEEIEGINVPTKDAFFVFPEWERKHNGKPFMVKIVDQKIAKVPLDWNDTFVSIVHGAAISDKTIVLTASAKEPKKEGVDFPFSFHSFDSKSMKRLHSTIIGEPIRVYWFPKDSNLVIQDGFAYVAWMGFDGTESTLNFSRFDPTSGKCITRKLGRGWGNSSASIGIIADSALICFHRRVERVVGDEPTWLAEIAYEHRNLPELFRKEIAEETGPGQPDTHPDESKSEGSDKPQPESEGRFR